ncbi:MAG: DUF4252 domain-containing protein [Bacteroidaceae bacterium]|nr:DUF4252 domain-containing protein [Bacteroidaceae bacterium]
MKRFYIISLLLALSTLFCQAQQSYFDKYADMDGVSSVYISKSMLKMFPNMSGKINGVNVGNLAGRLECIQILSSDSTEIIKQLRKETKDVNTKSGYEELMRIRDDGERVNIYFKEKKNKKNEFVLIADESDEYTIISIVGELTLQEMQEMVSGL